ncbi:MAG TPA: hypothetical protein VM143_10365 [Acidimicrobiales bacterium]|nr:hypothetical protein [Acidimicrobiales bacterium]
MRLHDGEPFFGPGRREPVATTLEQILAAKSPPTGPFILAIDGRSSNGKSTLAAQIAAARPMTAVVHTDDIAWWHSRFGWDNLLVDGVIIPVRRGQQVDFRPPAWDERDRPGSVTVPSDATLVVVEGVGSARRSLAPHLDAIIWVHTDLDVTERRDAVRVAAEETDQAGYEGWMAEEVPFQAAQRTWERADVIVSGEDAPVGELVVLHKRL